MGDITIFSESVKKAFTVLTLILSFFIFQANLYSQEAQNNLNQGTQSEVFDESSIQIADSTNSEADLLLNSGSGSMLWSFIRMILVLALVIALIWLVIKLLKKNNIGTGDDDPFLRRVSSVSLGQGKSVQIVTLVDEAFLVGVSENSVNLISRIDDKELVNALNVYAEQHGSSSKPKNFAELMAIFSGTQNKKSTEEKKSNIYDGSTAQVLDMLKKQSDRLNKEDK